MVEKTEPLTISDLILSGNQDPDRPAIESPGYRPLTYRDLRNQVILVVKTLNAKTSRLVVTIIPSDAITVQKYFPGVCTGL